MNVGLIGLGRMGRPMARRIADAGHDLVVYNRTARPAPELDGSTARHVSSIQAACDGRDVVISMLSDDAALVAVVGESGAVRDSLKRGGIHIAMGTHGVATIRQISRTHADAGQSFVAAPVLGRPEVAAAGQVGIIAGGPPAAVEQCAPILQAIGRRTFRAGDKPEAASALKLANNLILGCALEAMGEGFALTRKHGVDSSVLYDMLADGMFTSPAYKTYGKIIADEAYDRVGISAKLGLKDAQLAVAAAEACGVPLPSTTIFRDRLLSAIAHGDGDKDWSVVAREEAKDAGLE